MILQALSDKTRFELFARTVPPDTFQVRCQICKNICVVSSELKLQTILKSIEEECFLPASLYFAV